MNNKQTAHIQTSFIFYKLQNDMLFLTNQRQQLLSQIRQRLTKYKMRLFPIYFVSILFFVAQSEQTAKAKQPWIPKIIWTWWDSQLSQNNHKMKIFDFNHKKYAKGWQIRHLNYSNQQQWLSQIPDNHGMLYGEFFKNSWPSRRSELIRLMVLKHFGGVYIDYSMALTQPLDWLLNIQNLSEIQNNFGDQPDVLLLYNKTWSSSSNEKTKDQNGREVLISPIYHNYIIAAKPKTKFLQKWYDKFVEIRKQSHLKYGADCSKSTIKDQIQYYNMNTFYQIQNYQEQAISAYIVMQVKQQQFDRIWKIDKSKPRKFAVKHYKIWTMAAEETSFLMPLALQWKQKKIIESLFQLSIQQNIVQKSSPKYFILFNKNLRDAWHNYLLNEESLKKIQCPIQNFILQDSISYQYFLKDYPTKFYSNPVIKNPNEVDCYKNESTNKQIQGLENQIWQQNTKNIQKIEKLYEMEQELQNLRKKLNESENRNQKLTIQQKKQLEVMQTQFQKKIIEKQEKWTKMHSEPKNTVKQKENKDSQNNDQQKSAQLAAIKSEIEILSKKLSLRQNFEAQAHQLQKAQISLLKQKQSNKSDNSLLINEIVNSKFNQIIYLLVIAALLGAIALFFIFRKYSIKINQISNPNLKQRSSTETDNVSYIQVFGNMKGSSRSQISQLQTNCF